MQLNALLAGTFTQAERLFEDSPSLCLVQTCGIISRYFCICLWRHRSLIPRLWRASTSARSCSMWDTRHQPVSSSETINTCRHISWNTLDMHLCDKLFYSVRYKRKHVLTFTWRFVITNAQRSLTLRNRPRCGVVERFRHLQGGRGHRRAFLNARYWWLTLTRDTCCCVALQRMTWHGAWATAQR